MTEPEKVKLESMDIAQEKCEQLKKLFPEAFAEDKIDFDQLKRALGAWVEPGRERFSLNWPGKAEYMKIIQQPSVATLKPARDESVNFDATENLFIEGDNLEVLKLLQKSYFGKVKMIYIDPPYNTGNEFIYPDKYSETLDTYLEYTGQIDGNGHKFSTNIDSNGRYHSRWLNMMYPRLYLARNLLREDGVIFISIDDHEQANLKALCDQIFGEENFVGSIIWSKKRGKDNSAKYLSRNHEYLITIAKDINNLTFGRLEMPENTRKSYTNPDNDERGDYRLQGIWARGSQGGSKYSFRSRSGEEFNERLWLVAIETMKKLDFDNRLVFKGDKIYKKLFLSEYKGDIPETIWLDASNAANAADELKSLFDSQVFDTVKPTPYLKKMLKLGVDKDDIILDFFAGSCTTAHAVLDLNKEDEGNRRFIMVQLPEPCDEKSKAYKDGYKTIADIGKKRIRLAGKKIEEEQNCLLDFNGERNLDLGFKVFKLSKSNFKVWEGDIRKIENLQEQLFDHVDHIDGASRPEDILYELLLKSGFPLTTQVEKLHLAGKDVLSIEEGALLICLDKDLTQELIDAIAGENPRQVICLDYGFKGNDQLKANAVQTFKVRAQQQESEIVFKTV